MDRGWLYAACYEGDALVRAEPFSHLSLELGSLWLPAEAEAPRALAVAR